jgi:hypothetical protein
MELARTPRALFVYFTYTKQAGKIADDMSTVFQNRGWDVHHASIEFTDPRYTKVFSRFPMKHCYGDVLRMLIPQLRRKTGEIRIPSEVEDGDYDLVCIGSPTWWLTTCMPIRSFLESDVAAKLLDGQKVGAFVVCRRYWRNNVKTVRRLATEHGADYLDSTHFVFAGGQIKSLLSLVSYLGTGEHRRRYLGVKIPPSNLQPDSVEAARAFAGVLLDRLVAEVSPA